MTVSASLLSTLQSLRRSIATCAQTEDLLAASDDLARHHAQFQRAWAQSSRSHVRIAPLIMRVDDEVLHVRAQLHSRYVGAFTPRIRLRQRVTMAQRCTDVIADIDRVIRLMR